MYDPKSWFKGTDEIDQGEHGYDGRIWEPPDNPSDPDAEPYEVARVLDETVAELIIHRVMVHNDLLAACKAALPYLESLAGRRGAPQEFVAARNQLRTAIARAS